MEPQARRGRKGRRAIQVRQVHKVRPDQPLFPLTLETLLARHRLATPTPDTKIYVPIVTPTGDNRIINGDCRIDQRNNNGASGTANGYTVDRWFYSGVQASKLTWQQQNSPGAQAATGFPYGLKFTSSSAYTPLATDYFTVRQPIEADMIQDFNFGTANAQPVTLSFWAFSTLAGTFGGSLWGSSTRTCPFSFTLPASVWTKIAVTIPGDTGGTWALSGNAAGLAVYFDLGAGANFRGPAGVWASADYRGATGGQNVVATNGAVFVLTGVKLEIGTIATPFNRQSLAKSMADCQRYFCTSYSGNSPGTPSATNGNVNIYTQGLASGTNSAGMNIYFPVAMRAIPTLTIYSPTTGASGKMRDAPNNADVTATVNAAGYCNVFVIAAMNVATPSVNLSAHYTASAEL